tara:strand:+ start:100 stop:933 length:834 start_codon:yes stop_codon:yes gene_type:complete
MKITVATTYTNPEERRDPWKEALSCYEDFADEIVVTGSDWPHDFSWELIGETFNKGFKEASGDWVMRMDIDYFIHEKQINNLKKSLIKYSDYPAICFPQYQFFIPSRFHLKTRLCIALNKKSFPNIKLNGGGDMCLATLNSTLIQPKDIPNVNIPIYQYDSMFRTKKLIALDRSRFASAWFKYFGEYGDRGGSSPDIAYEYWYKNIMKKFSFHTNKINIDNHPKYIKEKLKNLNQDQFGYDGFGLKVPSKNYKHFIVGKKDIYFGASLNNLNRFLDF